MKNRLVLVIGVFYLVFVLPIAASQKKKEELDLTQPYLLLSGKKAKRLQQNLDRAAAADYRIVQTAPRGGGSGGWKPALLGGFHHRAGEYLVLLEKVPAAEQPYQYLVLREGSDKKLERKINEAAAKGFRLLSETLVYDYWTVDIFGGSGTLFGLMEKAPEPMPKLQYRIFERILTGRLQKDIQEAATEGYQVLLMVQGGGYTVVMQRAVESPTEAASAALSTAKKEYLLLSTDRLSTMRRELQEATPSGQYAVVDANQNAGSGEYLVLLEKVATPLYKQAIAFDGKALGGEHTLAELYREQGKYADAEPLFQRALAIDEEALGPEHPHVAASLNNLAELYRAQGKYTEAEPLYQRALIVLTRAVGPEHPDVATILGNHARMLRGLNRHDEAEKMEARAQAIRAKHAQEIPQR